MDNNANMMFGGQQDAGDNVLTTEFVVGLIGQVSLALLIVFIIAAVVFSRTQQEKTEVMEERVVEIEQTPQGELYKQLEEAQIELEQQKMMTSQKEEEMNTWREKTEALQKKEINLKETQQKVEELQQKLKQMETTTLGEKVKELENARMSMQRQQILAAIEKKYAQERANLRLNIFVHDNIDKTSFYKPQAAVNDGIIDKQIKMSSDYANETLPYKEKMEENWHSKVLSLANLREVDLTKENKIFLKKEVTNRINVVYRETVDLQSRVLSQLQDYYLQNQENFEDEDTRNLAKKWIATTDPEQKAAIARRIQEKVGDYTKKTLEEQDVYLLREALKSIKHTW